ncbi:MAG TPA: aminotransferase class I/II-fold pyridoxal phosphate-dependent enzyme [Bryobacteraceae bacterium]|jgi:histidinol-phosphate/aromatic aminotransferase/cobyric acid decarboxylase-like protein/CTP:phosphocholine cytidylyltransferase-like protein|nr:aminotransferase class I/II-fold pyridoxal phosphate-dependent enzyme [Bryobacteraceae bacterium]
MKAIILAAGFGKRMRPLTDSIHKTMLMVGGRTVIQWIVDSLLENGISELVVVTGYRADELKRYLSDAYPDLSIRYVHNARYAETNNISSMALALNSIDLDSDILLIECDLIFEPAVIAKLLRADGRNVALVDHYRSGMDGTVVDVADGRIIDVIVPQRQGPGFVFAGKYKTLNIYRFSRDFCRGPFKKMLDYYTAINENAYYEIVLGVIIYLQQEAIHAEILDVERWAEIDDPNDIAVARYVFEPSSRSRILNESHGGYWNYDVIDFCYLRNMYFPSGAIYSELRNSLPALLQNYGSAQTLLDEKLAYYLLCEKENLVVLNGASQAFPALAEHFADASVLLPAPVFGEYERAFPKAFRFHDLGTVDLEQLPNVELTCLINPNNPTGSVLSTKDIYAFAAAWPERTILCDESFLEFSDESSIIGLLERQPIENVIVIKSLSKTLGVPGLRLGYVYTANAAFRTRLRCRLPVWNINSIAEHFLEIILKHRGAIADSFAQTKQDRKEFAEWLWTLDFVKQVWPSGGNFLLVELNADQATASRWAEEILLRDGLRVKDISPRFPGNGAYWRVGVRLPQENWRLIQAMRRLTPASMVARP